MSEEAFTPLQLEQLRQVFREVVADAGLRLDGPDHVDSAREDFRFVRKLRLFTEATASKIGWVVIGAVIGAVIWLITLGANTWKGS